mgnify:CR=1 FL=1
MYCKKCNEEKDISEFYKNKYSCKSCLYKINRERLHKNMSDPNKRKLLLEKKKINNKRWNDNNKESIRKTRQIHYLKNKESINKKCSEYRRKNRKKISMLQNNYIKNRSKVDVLYALTISIRGIISKTFRRSSFTKKSKTFDILGCTYQEFKLYLENKFESWMSWENRGLYNGEINYGWDIDHIIPISSAKTEEEIIKLNHYTNLQPLCSKINRDIKRAKS